MNLSGMRYRFTLRYCLSLLVVVGGLGGLLGQGNVPVRGEGMLVKQKTPSISLKALCNDNAGKFTRFFNINMKSNSFGSVGSNGTANFVPYSTNKDTIFLCRGDEVTIDLDESTIRLDGDPERNTPSGIAYAAYDCPPSQTGETLNDFLEEPCIISNGLFPFNRDSLSLFSPVDYRGRNFNLRLENSEPPFINDFFPDANGRPQAKLLFIAPITVDAAIPVIDAAGNETGNFTYVLEQVDTTGNGDIFECNNQRVDQTFAVAWLNPISMESSTVDACNGSFVVAGGVSELRNSTDYNISITNTITGASATLAKPGGDYRPNETVNYTVPSAGDYRIEISDGIGCDLAPMVVSHTACIVTPPSADLTATVTATDITCAGTNNGAITVDISGGTAPYRIAYARTNPTTPTVADAVDAPAAGPTTIADLPGGQYTLTVSDAAGNNTGQLRAEILQPNETVGIDVTQGIQCFDEANGTLRAVIFDGSNEIGSTGYSFAWTGPNGFTATTAEINQLGPGAYTVTATSPDNCVTTDSETLRSPNRLVVQNSTSATDPATCNGVSDGTINIEVTGGTVDANGDYTISWSDGVVTTGDAITRTNLLPGNYSATVTDANGCTPADPTTFTITAEKTLVLTASTNGVSCFGEVDGNIVVSAATEGAPATLPFRAKVLNAADSTDAQNFRNLDGDGSTPTAFADLPPGDYIVVLQDSDPEGCEIQQAITITEPALLEIEDVVTTDVGCPDEAGTATVNVTGGTAPYTYRFVNDSLPNPADSTLTFDSTTVDTTMLNTIGDLQADTNYVVIVTDANGCVDTTTFFINSPPRATIQPIAPVTISCPGDSDGQLSVTATPPPGDSITITDYTWYRLNPNNTLGEQVSIGRTTSPTLSVGAYVVEIKLSNDCTSFGFGQVRSPGLVQLDSVLLIDPTCLGDNTGSIFLFPSGGTPNPDGGYNYRFSNASGPSPSNSINGLAPGRYDVTITDANGCQPALDTFFTINEPVGITGTFTTDDVSCPSDTISDGIATFEAAFTDGTTGTFDFIWSTGDTVRNVASNTQRNLSRGPISVTVTDGFCPQVFTDTIGSPEDFAFDIETESVTCNGLENGAAQIDVTGGTPAYTFEYVGRTETGTTLTDVPAGAYQLIVTDSRGCVADTFAFGIDEPDPLVLAIDQDLTTPLVTCAGDEDGIVAIQIVSNNNNPLAIAPYSWSDNVTDDDDEVARNLSPGLYSVTVTDSLGCQDSVSYTILDPQPIFFTLDDVLPPNCFGETTEITIDTAFGGQSSGLDDFTFTINNDGFLIRAGQPGTTFAGETIITVFDSVGCTAQDTFDIQQPDEIIIDLEDRIVIELGDSLQQLNPIITPPNGEYAYRWTPDRFLSSDSIRNPFIFPTSDQEYTFEVTDSSGCSALEDVFVVVDANRNIYIPNGFSPNGDGRNDDFRIFGCRGVVGITQVNIFNRWGGLVYENSDLLANCLDGTLLWNGNNATLQGKPVDPGVYVYTIEVLFLDNETLTYRGDISVIR